MTAHAVRPFIVHAFSTLTVTFLVAATVLIPVWSTCTTSCHASRAEVHSSDMTLSVQLEALRTNHERGSDDGIALAFLLASDANRAVTGPLARFTALVKSDTYAPLLNHASSEVTLLRETTNAAVYHVAVTTPCGLTAAYQWSLSLDEERGVFLTDRVVRLK